ncbi:TPA: hypothetical protein NGU08_004547 [Vibrio parahaemolyticus]|nr:hypothetical protein [Vibrio parahaemolyticus]
MIQITSGFSALLFLVFGIFSIIGLMVHFVPSYEYALYSQYAVFILSVVVVFLIYRSIKKQKENRNQRLVKKGKDPLPTDLNFKEALMLPMGVFFVLYFSIIYGFPSVVHVLIASHQGEVQYVAYKPRIDYMNTRPICLGAVTVESPLILPQRVCNVGRYTYETLEDGDMITIYGKQSYLGIGM